MIQSITVTLLFTFSFLLAILEIKAQNPTHARKVLYH
jgi:hypothetical protein